MAERSVTLKLKALIFLVFTDFHTKTFGGQFVGDGVAQLGVHTSGHLAYINLSLYHC